MHEAGHPKPVLWDNLERSGGEGAGRSVRIRGHVYTCGYFMSVYGKYNHNIAK